MGFYATVKMNELIYQCEWSLKQSRRKKARIKINAFVYETCFKWSERLNI